MPTFDYTVNDETQSTTEKILTAQQILTNAGIDTDTNYLVQIIGNTQKSYKDNPAEEIHMHPKMKFVAIFKGETPVA